MPLPVRPLLVRVRIRPKAADSPGSQSQPRDVRAATPAGPPHHSQRLAPPLRSHTA